MRKVIQWLLLPLIAISFQVQAQDYNISFAILGSIDKPTTVKVENTTQGTEKTLNGSDVLNLVADVTVINDLYANASNALQVYPNPVGETATLTFNNPEAGNVAINLVNTAGVSLARVSSKQPQGMLNYTLSGLSVGNYIISVQSGSYRSSCVVVSQLVQGGEPQIVLNSVQEVYQEQLETLKVAKVATPVKMQYTIGDVLKFTATLNAKNTIVNSYIATQNDAIEFSFLYKVTFNDYDNSEISTFNGEFDAAVIYPSHPDSRIGYNPNGWDVENATIPANDDLVITAQYETIFYSITYQNVGTTNSLSNPVTYTVATNDIVLAVPTDSTGYTFAGWFTDAAFVDTVSTPAIGQGSTGDTAFYAKWTAIPYAISYHNVGTTNSLSNPLTYTLSTNDIVLAVPVDSIGYTFAGWFTDATFLDTVSMPAIVQGSTGDTVFYAKWIVTPYSISYYNVGTINSLSNPVTYTVSTNDIALAVPTDSTGYTFAGWFTDAAFVDTVSTPAIGQGITGDTVFYAKWTVTPYTISYYNVGTTNSSSNPVVYTVLTNDIALAVPADSTGYTFTGWFTDATFLDTVSMPAIVQGSTGDTVFYAKWTAIPYAISYYNVGTTNSLSNPVTYTVATNDIVLVVPTDSTGYTFAGWFTDAAFVDTVSTPAIAQGSTGDTVFYAKWTVTSYTISYYNVGTTNSSSNPVVYTVLTNDIALSVPADSTGYTFAGWFTDATFLDTVSMPAIVQGSTGHAFFYAKWGIIDSRDNNFYRTVKIDTQIWLAENLRASIYADGTPIPNVDDRTQNGSGAENDAWGDLANNDTDKAYCWYDNDSITYSQTYGALYTYAAATNGVPYIEGTSIEGVQGVCPTGWHLPSATEWTTLENYITNDGHSGAEGAALKATSGWKDNGNGTDNYSFSALPSGIRYTSTGTFNKSGSSGNWWGSTQSNASKVYYIYLNFSIGEVFNIAIDKSYGLSVRCVKD